jgi:hypothetical protein
LPHDREGIALKGHCREDVDLLKRAFGHVITSVIEKRALQCGDSTLVARHRLAQRLPHDM